MTDQTWLEDARFVRTCGRIASDYKCSVLLVLHPTKAFDIPSLDKVGGGAGFGRFSDAVFWLYSHAQEQNKVATSLIQTCCGSDPVPIGHSRTLYFLKSRSEGTGLRVACDFKDLQLKSYGFIKGKPKRKPSE
jgi:hypothetical protein